MLLHKIHFIGYLGAKSKYTVQFEGGGGRGGLETVSE